MGSEEVLKMDFDTMKAILNWLVPKNAYEVRSFHGLSSLYRKFIKNFSKNLAPFIDTFRGGKHPLKWIEVTDRNFKLSEKKITKKPILAFPSFDKVFQVETDARGTMGAV